MTEKKAVTALTRREPGRHANDSDGNTARGVIALDVVERSARFDLGKHEPEIDTRPSAKDTLCFRCWPEHEAVWNERSQLDRTVTCLIAEMREGKAPRLTGDTVE